VKFYEGVFGWKVDEVGGPVDYWLVTSGPDDRPGINGAIMRRMGSEPSSDQAVSAFVNTIEVDSLEETERRVPDAGGEQVLPPQEIPDVGKLAYFKDTEGNIFGALEPS
jgi:predicted enzyme related to lactoylglutathione lyase